MGIFDLFTRKTPSNATGVEERTVPTIGEKFEQAAEASRVHIHYPTQEALKGSESPSPTYQKLFLIRGSLPPADAFLRYGCYDRVRQAFVQDVTFWLACRMLCGGAVGNNGFKVAVRPRDGGSKQRANKLRRDVLDPLNEEFFSPSRLATMAISLGQYANLPIELERKGRVIIGVTPLPPFAFAKNVDEFFRFKKNAKDAYLQYDTATWKPIQGAQWSEEELIWAQWNCPIGELYGFPPALIVLAESEALRDGIENMSHARKGALPEKIYHAGDKDGQPFDDISLRDFKRELPSEKIKRGEKQDRYPVTILNGGSSPPSILAPATNYFQDLADFDLHVRRIASVYQVPAPLLFPTDALSSDLYTQLTDALYEAQSGFASIIKDEIIMPIFKRAASLAGFDTSEFYIELIWSQRKLPSRLLQEAMSVDAWSKGDKPTITLATATRIQSNYLGVDSDAEMRELEAQKAAEEPEEEEPEEMPMPDSDNLPQVKAAKVLQGDVLTRNPQLGLVHSDAIKAGLDKGRLKGAN